MMFWYGSHVDFWQATLMVIAMLAVGGLIVWVLYTLVGGPRKPESRRDNNDARDVFDQRFARGEIDVDEYRRLLAVINEHTSTEVGARR